MCILHRFGSMDPLVKFVSKTIQIVKASGVASPIQRVTRIGHESKSD